MREFGSHFEITYGPNDYFKNISKYKNNCAFVRSGREAILLIIRSLALSNGDTVLLPAYCCRSMDNPFLDLDINVEYYKLTKDLTIDLENLCDVILRTSPRIIMTMNYYGFTDTRQSVKYIKMRFPAIMIIEDFSHCLFSFNELFNPDVDYYFASIRKSLGIADGGICMTNCELSHSLVKEIDTPFVSDRIQSCRLKAEYQFSYDPKIKSLSKTFFKRAEDCLDENKNDIFAMSVTSLGILNHTCIELIKYAREVNYRHLYNLLKHNKAVELLYAPSPYNHSPFAMPVLLKNRYSAQALLADLGVYAPVLWTIRDKAKEVCPISKRISENMLAIPIDQRFNYWDIEEIGTRINNSIK